MVMTADERQHGGITCATDGSEFAAMDRYVSQ